MPTASTDAHDHSEHTDSEAAETAATASATVSTPVVPIPTASPTDTAQGGATSTPLPTPTPMASGGSAGDTGTDATGGTGGSTAVELEGLLAFGPPGAPTEEMCGYCHGVNGEGTTLAPEIQHPVEDFATWVIRNGRQHPDFEEAMPQYGEDVVSAQLLGEIFAFLQSVPVATTGEGLFLDHCANCHGTDARGGISTHDLTGHEPDHLGEHVREGAHPGEFENRTEYMHAYTVDELSDQQLQLIAEHIQSL